MKQRISIALLFALLLASFVGCGESAAETAADPQSSATVTENTDMEETAAEEAPAVHILRFPIS